MKIKTDIKDIILKPKSEVFQAIVDAKKLSGYFISRATKSIEKSQTIIWYFDDYCAELSINVLEVKENESIHFEWVASGILAKVQIILTSENENKTKIQIIEGNWEMNESGVKSALQQTQGWTDFICSMKAYLYTGINLRNGRKKPAND